MPTPAVECHRCHDLVTVPHLLDVVICGCGTRFRRSLEADPRDKRRSVWHWRQVKP
jgi:hypothetical protein